MEPFRITRDEQRCVVCLECIQVCPQSQPGTQYPVIVESDERTKPPQIAHIENCIQCLLCVNFCRAMAIKFENYHAVEQLFVSKGLIITEADKYI